MPCGGYKGQHLPPQQPMLAQLPSEIVDQIIECLPSKEDALSIALVCSALRPHANRRLFRSLRVFVERGNIVPVYAEMVLSYPHLLQYPTHLMIWPPVRPPKSVYSQEHGEIPTIPVHYLWTQLVNMPRLTSLELHMSSGDYGAVLSALEGLDAARNITLHLGDRIQNDISISENPLPVKRLKLCVNERERSHRLEKQLLQKCSQSLFELRLILYDACTPDFPFLPFLRILALVALVGKGSDITPWLPFLMQHPSLTSVMLSPAISSVNPVQPFLLPNLQSLKAHPLVIEQLIPGRPVHSVTIYRSNNPTSSYNTIFQSLALPCVPVTTLYIDATVYAIQSTKTLVDMIRSLPMLRELDLLIGYQVCRSLKGKSLVNDFNSFHLPLMMFCGPLESAGI